MYYYKYFVKRCITISIFFRMKNQTVKEPEEQTMLRTVGKNLDKAEAEDDFDEEEAKDIQKLRIWSGHLYILPFNIVDWILIFTEKRKKDVI